MPALLVIVLIVAGLALCAARRPSDFSYSRSATMNASPATIFPQINDVHNWQSWSPWSDLDPNCKRTFEGPPAGPGAIFRWDGNNKVGQGSMTIVESRADEFVKFNLVFLRPFKGTNTAEFTIRPEGGQSVVTWTTYGKTGFIGKVMGMIMNCEKMMDKQFEKGFSSLKTIVEK